MATTTRVEIKAFDGDNDFSLWKMRIMAQLGVLGLKGTLTDFALTKTEPLTKSEEKQVASGDESSDSSAVLTKEVPDPIKIEKSEQAINIIINHISDTVLRKVNHYKTAATLWELLNELYMETSLPNRIYAQLKFYSFRMMTSKTIDQNFCKKEGHVKKDCFARKKKFENEEQGEAGVITEKLVYSEALSMYNQEAKEKRVIDSGCTYHMTSRMDWFSDFNENESTLILLGDDHTVESRGTGTVKINTHGGAIRMLKNVTFVPNLRRNLISTDTLDKLGFKHEGGDGKIRLGHMSVNNMKILTEKGLIEKKDIKELDFCEHCVMGKSKKLSFNVGKHITEDLLGYLHADLWGSPNVTPSLSDETFDKFCEWKELVENQVNKKIKVLRTDNGLEFCNLKFDEYCKKNGIERHRTCTYTPQQNGVAERMNRTLMEKKHLRRFGSIAYVHRAQGKLKPRALKDSVYKNLLPESDKEQIEGELGKETTITVNDSVKEKGESFVSGGAIEEISDSSDSEAVATEEDSPIHTVNLKNYQLARDRTRRITRPPTKLSDYTHFAYALVMAEKLGEEEEPHCYHDARNDKDWEKWNGVADDMELEQMDVKTAFLHGELDQVLYMEQPEGFEADPNKDQVCLLKKSLYGLKQAPRQWNKKFNAFMMDQGFTRSLHDSCVYVKEVSPDQFVYLLVYVDDMLIAGKSMAEVNKVKEGLSLNFEMKDMGAASRILGIDIERNREEGTLCLSQSKYLEKVIQRFRMADAKGVSTPIGAHFKLSAVRNNDESVDTEVCPYSSAVGSVMYAMIGTRPDVVYALGLVNGSEGGLYKRKRHEDTWICDSDYVADLDKRRSISGYVFTVGGNNSASCMSKNNAFHERTKHIDVKFYFIRDIIEAGEVEVEKIHTSRNPVDMLTKVIPLHKFEAALDHLKLLR
ncbi:putative polyprotein [Arabidopsis thaliana]|uniref:Putative polyprotein n=1 Tax=Arabidopsis thaliana TaxID=3702 RepID=Q9XEB4_ARATH|nr:putative polyprotein [Arabidopsis thaliana]CAB80825.1 putative polyprotein [Arabidopsis thaliana]